jgi:hypothetical protein
VKCGATARERERDETGGGIYMYRSFVGMIMPTDSIISSREMLGT